MMLRVFNGTRPGLLVSVRNVDEALAALAGGTDVIDVKEPSRGPLGPADDATIAEVVCAVAGRAPVTAAAGELVTDCGFPTANMQRKGDSPLFSTNLTGSRDAGEREKGTVPEGVALFKIGLAGCAARDGWRTDWRRVIASSANGSRPAAVVYADWRAADAPDPDAVLAAAVEAGCPALLVDTWDKSAGTLFDAWPSRDLAAFVERVHARGLAIALAGSLSGSTIGEAARLGADLVAVRGAACEGGRGGTVSRERVRALRRLVTEVTRPTAIRC